MRTLPQSWPPLLLHSARALMPLALVAAGTLGLLGSMLALLYQPDQTRLETAKSAYETARQAQLRVKQARHNIENVQGVWRQLPARTEFATVVLAVSESAQQDRVAIPGMSYSFQKLDSGRALQVSMTFRAAGAYDAIRRFIHRLETADWYLVVESLDAARSSKPNLVEFNVRVVTFLKPDPPSSGGET